MCDVNLASAYNWALGAASVLLVQVLLCSVFVCLLFNEGWGHRNAPPNQVGRGMS